MQGLATLPLIGGSIALIGQLSAVAVRPDLELIARYTQWLAIEFGKSIIERTYLRQLRDDPAFAVHARDWRREWCRETPPLACFGSFAPSLAPPPSSRAALVVSAVGHEWRKAG